MFYETKVLDAYGNLKQTISPKELHNRHWQNFHRSDYNISDYPKKTSSKQTNKIVKGTEAY